jgi:hypothetical protein
MKHTYLVQNTNSTVLGKSVGLSELYLGFHQYDRTQFCFNTQLSDKKNQHLTVGQNKSWNWIAVSHSVFFFFGDNCLPLGDKKKSSATHTKDYYVKNSAISCQISRKKILKLPYVDNRFQ